MKNLVIILMGALVALFMSGCSMKVEYQPEFVDGALKNNLNKVEQTVVVKQHTSNVIGKRPYACFHGAGLTSNVDVAKIGDEVAKDFFEQYFQSVKFGVSNRDGLFVDYKITDFIYTNGELNGQTIVTYDMSIKAIYKGKNILDKTYKSTYDSGTLIAIIEIRSGWDVLREVFNKSVISVLENEVKPDLLKALEENK